MMRFYAITLESCKVIMNASAIQAVSTHSLQYFSHVSSAPTSKVTHFGTIILDTVIVGRSFLNSPFISHIIQNAEGQEKLS